MKIMDSIQKAVVLLLLFSLSGFCAVTYAYADKRIQDYTGFNPSHDFQLTDQHGNSFQLKDHRGKIILLFFWFLSCPDVCPLTLSKVSRVYTLLGEKDRSHVLTAFVSVDPERDTQEGIKEYLTYFDIDAVGLTGTQEEIDSVVDAYKAYYEKVEVNSKMGYLINHTSYLYLIAPDGHVRYLFRPEDDVRQMTKIIKKIYKDYQ